MLSSSSSTQMESNVVESDLTEMQSTSESSQIEPVDVEMPIQSSIDDNCPEFDIGKWLGQPFKMTTAQKAEMLNRRWVPPENYNFRVEAKYPNRRILHNWLNTYAPWLSYSKKLKEALCIYCVLFPPIVVQGVLGAFIKKPLTKYRDMHTSCKNHASSQWYRNSTQAAKLFLESVPVDVMMVTGHEIQIERNRKILSSTINTVVFCGSHDMALKGKQNDEGNIFQWLPIFSSIILYVSNVISICRKFCRTHRFANRIWQ